MSIIFFPTILIQLSHYFFKHSWKLWLFFHSFNLFSVLRCCWLPLSQILVLQLLFKISWQFFSYFIYFFTLWFSFSHHSIYHSSASLRPSSLFPIQYVAKIFHHGRVIIHDKTYFMLLLCSFIHMNRKFYPHQVLCAFSLFLQIALIPFSFSTNIGWTSFYPNKMRKDIYSSEPVDGI